MLFVLIHTMPLLICTIPANKLLICELVTHLHVFLILNAVKHFKVAECVLHAFTPAGDSGQRLLVGKCHNYKMDDR